MITLWSTEVVVIFARHGCRSRCSGSGDDLVIITLTVVVLKSAVILTPAVAFVTMEVLVIESFSII